MNEELIAAAQARISERAALIRRNEVASLGPFDRAEDEERAKELLSKSLVWQRIELWEKVERLKAALMGSVPILGAKWLNRRLAAEGWGA